MLYTPAEAAIQTGRHVDDIIDAIKAGDIRATHARIEGEHLRSWARFSAVAAERLHVADDPLEVVADAS